MVRTGYILDICIWNRIFEIQFVFCISEKHIKVQYFVFQIYCNNVFCSAPSKVYVKNVCYQEIRVIASSENSNVSEIEFPCNVEGLASLRNLMIHIVIKRLKGISYFKKFGSIFILYFIFQIERLTVFCILYFKYFDDIFCQALTMINRT